MAKLYVGKNNAIPVRNAVSMHGDDIVDILNNEDLSNALDGKVDKVSTPSVLYGTDSNGQQTTYDLSLLFDTETAPDGYTDVEYITSGDNSGGVYYDINYQSATVTIYDLPNFSTVFPQKLSDATSTLGFDVDSFRFTIVDNVTKINVYGENTVTGDSGLYQSTTSYPFSDYGIYWTYTGSFTDNDTFSAKMSDGDYGQYIDTGINITKYNIGAVLYDEEQSTCADPTATHTSTPDSTDWYIFKGKMNNATTTYGEEITQFRFKITNVASTLFSVEIYANDKEVVYETYTDTTTDSLRGQYGVILSGNMTVGDEYVFYLVGRIQDTYAVETSIKLSDYQISQIHNNIFGSISQSGNFGCGLRCSENDGILFKHYVPNVQSGFAVPYNKGNWNNIKIEPSLFTLNGESYSLDSGDIRTVSGKTFILFGISNENGISVSGMSMKKTKIYKNGNLVFNGIPCVEDSSGIAGMYDLVTQQFFKSAKEGSEFIAGPVKESSSETNLGIEGENVLVGLDKEGKISAYTGKNGIVIEGTIGIDDYEELEYIESGDGTLAFDTKRHWGESGYNINSAKWEITYNQVKTSDASSGTQCQYVFGDGMFSDMGQNFNRIDFRFFRGLGSFPYTSNNGNTGAGVDDGIFLESLNTWNTFAFDYKKLYLNNVVIKELNSQISSTVHSKNFHIFNAPNAITSGEFGTGFIGKISKVTLIVNRGVNDNVTMAKFVPVRRKSDNELGFYDTVNGTFCPNIGEGIPIAGPAKTGTISLSKNLDKVLENMASNLQSSLIISQDTDSSGANKTLDQNITDSVLMGPNVKTLNNNLSNDVIIEGTAQGSCSIAIGKHSIGGANSVSIGYNAGYGTAGSNFVSIGYNARGLSDGVSIGYNSQAFGSRSISIGSGATSTENNSITIGYGTNTGYATTAIGASIVSPSKAYQGTILGYGAGMESNDLCTMPVALGAYTRIDGSYAIGVGYVPDAVKSNAIAIGNEPRTSDNYQIVIGYQAGVATAPGSGISYGDTYSIAIGYQARIASSWGISIGPDSSCSAREGIALGHEARTNNSNGNSPYDIAIGAETQADKGYGVAVGYNAQTTHQYAIAIGSQARGNFDNSIAIGHSAISANQGNIAIGNGATSRADGAIAIGIGAIGGRIVDQANQGSNGIAIGYNSEVRGFCGVATGLQAKAYGDNSVAIGRGAVAHTHSSVALGYGAETYEAGAVQLGTGNNSAANTLKFRDYPLIDASGILDYERLSSDTPTHGYVLTYDSSEDRLIWAEGSGGGGGYVLPPATTSTLGGIKVGQGLTITSDGTLSTAGGGAGGEGVWGQIEGNIEDQTDLMNILNSKFTQTLEMPKASNAYNGKTLQFLGITDLLYTHGYVYECQYKRISSLTGSTSDSTRFTVTFDAQRFEAYFKEYHPEIDLRDNTDYFIQYVSSMNKWTFYISGEGDRGIYFDTYNLPYVGINVSYIGQNEPEEEDQVNMVYYPASDEEHAPFGYIWNRLNVQPHVEVIDNVTSSSTTNALSANQGRVLQEQIDTLSSIGQFLAIWDCDTGIARYLTDGYQYTTGNYFIVGTEGVTDDTRSGTWSSEVVSAGPSGLVVDLDNITTFETTCGKVDREITFTYTSGGWKNTYNSSTQTKMQVYNTFGIEISTIEEGSYTVGDKVSVTYVRPTISYIPSGDTYDATTGHTTTTEEVHVSDMYFYDGTNWILLANHSKAIAIDRDLSTSSTNPVENATVTNALNSKVSKTSEANRVYGTTSLGEQIALELDEGLEIEDGKLKNTKTSGEWGAISGTLSDQTDLQEALDGKQNTLVAGSNITLVDDPETGTTTISSRGGGSGMGTIAITDIFTRPGYVEDQNYDSYRHKAWFHGNYENILFTTNADYDYLKANKEDLYVTISQRKHHGGKRRFNVCNDDRVKTNMKLHCWRMFTNKRWNFDYLGWETDFIPDLNAQQYEDNGSQISDLSYVYFYTKEDYGDDPDTMVSANPVVYFAVTRIDPYDEEQRPENDLPTTFEESYINGGNWGTCFNEIYCENDHLNDYSVFTDMDYRIFERISDYDITEFINSCSMNWGRPSDEMDMTKMKARVYELNGSKYYFWSPDWTDSGEDVFAHLDDNDNPIPNSVPEDKALIGAFNIVDNVVNTYTLIEDRPDLRWYRYNPSYSESDLQNFCSYAHGVQTDVDPDNDKLDYRYGSLYKYDYPIQPRRISQCKILMTDKAPWSKVWDEDEGRWIYPADKYNEYLNHAYTIDEIESNEDLRYLITCQKRIILVFPYTTAHFWMRSFGWQPETYRRMQMEIKRQSYYWESTEWGGQWTCDDYDEGGNPVVEDYTLQAMPEDRHNLASYFWKCWCLGDHSYSVYDEDSGESVSVNFECFRDLLGFIGNRGYSPRWNPNDLNKVYWMPVQFNICTGRDVSYNLKSQSTPIDKKMTITGSRHSNGYAGINGISQNIIS